MPCFATPPSVQLDNLQSTVSLYKLINIFTNVYPTWRIVAISCTSSLSENNKYTPAIAENRLTVLAKLARLKHFHIWYLWLTAAETQFPWDEKTPNGRVKSKTVVSYILFKCFELKGICVLTAFRDCWWTWAASIIVMRHCCNLSASSSWPLTSLKRTKWQGLISSTST